MIIKTGNASYATFAGSCKLAKALRDYGTGHMPNLWGDIKRIKVIALF